MLASGVVLGVAVGLLSGGTLARLAELRVGLWPVLAAAIVLRFVAPMFGELAAVAYVASFAGIVAVALIDRRLPGMALIALGAALNLTVVAANGGMPVDQAALAAAGASMPGDRLHLELTEETRLGLLADRLPAPLFRNVYSVGDVFLAAGGFWLPFTWMRSR